VAGRLGAIPPSTQYEAKEHLEDRLRSRIVTDKSGGLDRPFADYQTQKSEVNSSKRLGEQVGMFDIEVLSRSERPQLPTDGLN
jgi:hypothetical protein